MYCWAFIEPGFIGCILKCPSKGQNSWHISMLALAKGKKDFVMNFSSGHNGGGNICDCSTPSTQLWD